MIENEEGFETLLKSKGKKYRDRWSPHSVDYYESALRIDPGIENSYALRKNLVYSIQYMEFLELELKELKLHSVIEAILIKTYVVTGMSIIEGIFTNIVCSRGLQKTSKLKSLGTTQSNKTNFSGNPYVVKTELFEEVPEFDVMMNLDVLIKILI